MQNPSDYSAQFAEHLRSLGLAPTLVGALAAGIYRLTPRFTTDVDFMVPSFGNVAEQPAAEGYEVKTMADTGGEPYLIFVRGKGVAVDIMLAETDYHRGALERAVGGVLKAEDVIIQKLIAWRPRDQDDVASIVAAGHDLDIDYIERWAWNGTSMIAGSKPFVVVEFHR